MTPKSFRFDEKDQEMFEKIAAKYPFVRSDIDIIRYCLYFTLNHKEEVVVAVVPPEMKKEKEPEIPQAYIDEANAFKDDEFCPINAGPGAHIKPVLLSVCGHRKDGSVLKFIQFKYSDDFNKA